MMLNAIRNKVLGGEKITVEEARWLSCQAEKQDLYDAAHEITRVLASRKFDMCSIINAKSGKCPENCKWCAQSGHYKTLVNLYPLLPAKECVYHAVYNRKQGIRRFALVTSGKRVSDKELEQITDTIRQIKQQSDIKCCASMGLLTRSQLQSLYDSGVENYHCNIETAPPISVNSVPRIRSSRRWKPSIPPGKSVSVYAAVVLSAWARRWRNESRWLVSYRKKVSYPSPLNLLQPIPGTPMENTHILEEEEWLTTIALFRLINPNAFLRFSGGRAQLSEATQRKSLYIGINSAIIGDLLTTIGSKVEEDKVLFTSEGYSLTENTDWEK